MLELQLSKDIRIVYSKQASDILGRPYWFVDDEVHVRMLIGNKEYVFDIPRGYLTDGATVPRFLWSFVPLWDECTTAVVIHDYLCNYGRIMIDGKVCYLDRITIDWLFLKVMEFCKISKIKRYIIYNAVRLNALLKNHKKPGISAKKVEMENLIRSDLNKGYY